MADSRDPIERHRGSGFPGRGGAGTSFEPGAPAPAAAAPVVEVQTPRPATTRFPISYRDFLALKQAAAAGAIRGLTKRESASVQDRAPRGQRRAELATAAALAGAVAAPLAVAPTTAPVAVGNFGGISATGWLPPDCTMAAGPQHVLLSVNSSVAIYPKAGGAALLQRTLTTWFANVVAGNETIFDPKALYDQHAGRWVLVAAAREPVQQKSLFLLSISKTADPLGGWWNYAIDAAKDGTTATNNWADYPCVGVDNQALYLTANMFRFNGNFQYPKLRIVPKTGPYAGGTLTYRDFVRMKNADGSMVFTMQPCHTFGAPQVEYLVNTLFPTTASQTQNQITLWNLTNPITSPTLTRRTVATDPYAIPPDGEQQGGGPGLETGDIRLLNAVFRGGSVWTAFNTAHNWGDGVNVAAAHWFQINPGTGALTQQGIFGARRLHYYYPVVMPDTNGNMILVFTRSGPAEHPSMYFSGRASTDPLGTLQPSVLVKAGVANYVGLNGSGRNRWGDYNGIANDPTDGRVVWFYSEYVSAANTWGTWVGAARF